MNPKIIYFFGRETHIEELVTRLGQTRFLAVVGVSGSGKSSLVRAGLLPALESGFMAGAGTQWRMINFRPGGSPISLMAEALNESGIFKNDQEGVKGPIRKAIIESALRRSSRGLIEITNQARLPDNECILVLVDQFEEILRFRDASGSPQAESETKKIGGIHRILNRMSRRVDDANALVKLLLEASRIEKPKIYVVITLRSDFFRRLRPVPRSIGSHQ